MESIPFSQLAVFLHMETRDADPKKTTTIDDRTKSGQLELGLGAIKADTKHAGTWSFHLRRHRIRVRSNGRGRAVKARETIDVHDILCFIT